MRYSITEFQRDYPTDDICLDTIFNNRYGELKACPGCGVVKPKFYKLKDRKAYSCKDCRYQLHPLAGTIFHKSDTPLTKWFYAIYLFSVSKNGVSAKELERHLSVTYKTAWRIANQIRKLMTDNQDQLLGTVEVDETFIGSRKRGTDKPVVGMVKRQGNVRAEVIPNRNSKTLIPYIRKNIAVGSEVMTDEFKAYDVLDFMPDYDHKTIKHAREYVRGNTHTNTIEGFWSQLKRSLNGTYHVVSPKYLQSYVDEFAFRYNLRNVCVYPVLIERAGKQV